MNEYRPLKDPAGREYFVLPSGAAVLADGTRVPELDAPKETGAFDRETVARAFAVRRQACWRKGQSEDHDTAFLAGVQLAAIDALIFDLGLSARVADLSR